MIRNIIGTSIAIVGLNAIDPQVATAKTVDEYERCLKMIATGPYVESEMQADVICTMASNHAVGCGLDLVDMGMYPNLIEAVEYCMAPFPSRP